MDLDLIPFVQKETLSLKKRIVRTLEYYFKIRRSYVILANITDCRRVVSCLRAMFLCDRCYSRQIRDCDWQQRSDWRVPLALQTDNLHAIRSACSCNQISSSIFNPSSGIGTYSDTPAIVLNVQLKLSQSFLPHGSSCHFIFLTQILSSFFVMKTCYVPNGYLSNVKVFPFFLLLLYLYVTENDIRVYFIMITY